MLTNYWSVSKTAETDPSRPRPRSQVPRPRQQNSGLKWSRDQDRCLEDYISGRHVLT